jgi:hypothetical protein
VDLKPLTIFVGPSNTGKSYMAMAVYSVMKAFQGHDFAAPMRFPDGQRFYSNRLSLSSWEVPDEDSDVGKTVWAWAGQLEQGEGRPQQLTVSDLPENVRLWFEQLAGQEIEMFCIRAKRHLVQAFGEPAEFVNKGAKPADFRLVVRREKPRLNSDIPLPDEGEASFEFDISGAEIEPSPLVLLEYENGPGEEPINIFYEVMSSWTDSVEAKVLAGVPTDSYYLPAARSGIVQGHKVLASEIVRQSARKSQRGFDIPTLPGITTEFLGNLISLDRRMRGQTLDSTMEDAISFIENEVLHGKVDLDESSGLPIPEIVYMPVGGQSALGKFTLYQTSSMVSELAPLILFLKYLVRPDDLLILEEPESHLHPAAQRRMAQGIVRLVNAGVKVVITTHSDMFVGQINNFLALSQASQELIGEHGFEPSDFLKHDQVGAYLFKHDQEKRGSVIQPLGIDSDTGIDEDEFADVTEAIYNESIALQRDRIL